MEVDVVIVGAGSAGASLAARLSEDPGRSVLLIEAGPERAPGDRADLLSTVSFAATESDWGLRASVTDGRDLEYPQGRCMGGGSAVNGALAFRGAPEDFDRWAGGGCPSWTFEEMLGAYRRLEHDLDYGDSPVHGGEGPVPIVRWHEDELVDVQRAFREGCRAQGLGWTDDHNDPRSTGLGPFPMNRSEGRRMSTALTYLRLARRRPNLEVRTGTRVLRVELQGTSATGVTLHGRGGLETVSAGEVVVSAGAIQSPALLWRSGIGPAEDLRAGDIQPTVDLPAVGANLHDHPGVFYFLAPGRRPIDFSEPQYQLGARYTSAGGAERNDMFLSMMNYWDLSGSPDFQAYLGVPSVVVLTCGVHQPASRGRVRLRSPDPDIAPAVELNLLAESADVTRLVEGVRRLAAVAAHPAMAEFVGERLAMEGDLEDDRAVADHVRAVVAPWYHPVGTCAMGTDPVSSVVGDDLGVHGVEHLRVADASVIPTITRAPTNLTAIAIGERAAELIEH